VSIAGYLIDRWVPDNRQRGYLEKSCKEREAQIRNHLLKADWIGQELASPGLRPQIQRWSREQVVRHDASDGADGISRDLMKRLLNIVKDAYALAMSEADLTGVLFNPLGRRINLPAPNKARAQRKFAAQRRTAITLEQAAVVASRLNVWHRSIFWTQFLLGLRIGEALGLRLADVDWQTGWIDIAQQVGADGRVKNWTKTSSSFRRIPAPALLMDMLRAHRARFHPEWLPTGEEGDRLLLISPLGGTVNRYSSYRDALARAARETGITLQMIPNPDGVGYGLMTHDLRRSAATWLMRVADSAQPSIRGSVVSTYLGHKFLTEEDVAQITVEKYEKILHGELERLVVEFNDLLSRTISALWPHDDQMADLVTTREAADIAGVYVCTVRRLVTAGQLPQVHTAFDHRTNRIYIRRCDVLSSVVELQALDQQRRQARNNADAPRQKRRGELQQPMPAVPDEWVSLAAAAELLGIRKNVTARHHLIKAGLTRHQVTMGARRRVFYVKTEVINLRVFREQHADDSRRGVRNKPPAGWLTVQQAAYRLHLSRTRALTLLNSHKVTRQRDGERWLYLCNDVEELARRRRPPAGHVSMGYAAQRLGVSDSTLRSRIRQGDISAVEHDGNWWVDRSDIDG
jgi:integrase